MQLVHLRSPLLSESDKAVVCKQAAGMPAALLICGWLLASRQCTVNDLEAARLDCAEQRDNHCSSSDVADRSCAQAVVSLMSCNQHNLLLALAALAMPVPLAVVHDMLSHTGNEQGGQVTSMTSLARPFETSYETCIGSKVIDAVVVHAVIAWMLQCQTNIYVVSVGNHDCRQAANLAVKS
jgi:hypothetical protein